MWCWTLINIISWLSTYCCWESSCFRSETGLYNSFFKGSKKIRPSNNVKTEFLQSPASKISMNELCRQIRWKNARNLCSIDLSCKFKNGIYTIIQLLVIVKGLQNQCIVSNNSLALNFFKSLRQEYYQVEFKPGSWLYQITVGLQFHTF